VGELRLAIILSCHLSIGCEQVHTWQNVFRGASVEVLAGPERRRRWSVEQKQAIVAAALGPGAVVRDVARQADVRPSLIYCWRRDLRAAANGFAEVLVAPAGGGVAIPPVPAIEIEIRKAPGRRNVTS